MSPYWSLGIVLICVLVMLAFIRRAGDVETHWQDERDRLDVSVSNLDMECPVSVDEVYDWSRQGL